jgi:16S rRNA (cytosine967-C5)-methyltransferase
MTPARLGRADVGAGAVTPARACAYAVIRRVFEQGAYADRALHAEAAALDRRDRALATTLAYGTVQRRATLDHVIAELARRSPGKLDPPILAAIRLGLMQLLLLDGIAEHAAVHESVELAKRDGRGGAGLVNAVLRRATREGRAIVAALSDETPAGAATLHSVPQWLAELWWRELGPDQARALLRRVNEPAESALRVNTLVAAPDTIRRQLDVASHPASELPEGLVLEAPFDAHGSPLWEDGAIMPQSRGSMLVAHALAPDPGERVLDLCAAPGAKTTHLAALMGNEGSLTAIERHSGRAEALRRTLQRMRVGCATVRQADAAHLRVGGDEGGYDRVLVDPPCSGLGTLQSRPDLRWRTNPERIAGTARLQARVLRAAAASTRPGGTLVYSVCTISRAESEDIVDAFLDDHPQFAAAPLPGGVSEAGEPFRQLLPHRDGTDGFFIARLCRR